MKINKAKYVKQTIYIISISMYSILMFILFYRQCIGYNGLYLSDMEAYINEIIGIGSNYTFPYPLMFSIGKIFALFFNANIALALTITLLNTLSVIALKWFIEHFVKCEFEKRNKIYSIKWDYLIIFLTYTLFFISMLHIPNGRGIFGIYLDYRCNGVYTPNPFWNATYLATRPFTIIAFFYGIRVLDTYENMFNKRSTIIFGTALFLSTITKPSYTLIVMPVFFLIIVYRFLKSKAKNLKQSFYFGLSFMPTILALLYQYKDVFTGTNSMGEETGIGLEFAKAWSLQSRNIGMSIVYAMAFPIGVFLINLFKLKGTTWFRHGWQLILSGFIMFIFLYEKGFRLTHMNFSWGYMHGLFFVFVVSVMMLFVNTLDVFMVKVQSENKLKIIAFRIMMIIGWLGYLLHLICGLSYFLFIYMGNNSGTF